MTKRYLITERSIAVLAWFIISHTYTSYRRIVDVGHLYVLDSIITLKDRVIEDDRKIIVDVRRRESFAALFR